MMIAIPPLPEPGTPVTVQLEKLPEFLEFHNLEITRADKEFLYVQKKRETINQGDQNGTNIR